MMVSVRFTKNNIEKYLKKGNHATTGNNRFQMANLIYILRAD